MIMCVEGDRPSHMLAARRTLVAKQKYEVDMRAAAYTSALDHIEQVYNARGIFP